MTTMTEKRSRYRDKHQHAAPWCTATEDCTEPGSKLVRLPDGTPAWRCAGHYGDTAPPEPA